MIALIVGPDAASARAETDSLLRQHDATGLNTSRLDGKSLTIDEAVTAVGTPAFFGGGRVIVIDDMMTRASKSAGADGAESTSSSKGLDFSRLFTSVANGNVLIMVDQTLGTIPASIKKVAPAGSQMFGGEPPRGAALIDWLQRQAEKAGGKIDQKTARFLADRTFPQTWTAKPNNPAYDRPPDLDRLRGEIEKLVLAAHPGPVTAETVELMVASASEDRLFPFVEAVVTSRLNEAIPALESFESTGDDAARLIAQIFQQVELAAAAQVAGPANDLAAVGKDLGLTNPNRMIAVARTSKRGRITPTKMVKLALETDRMTKKGVLRHGDDALYHLMTADVSSANNDERGGN